MSKKTIINDVELVMQQYQEATTDQDVSHLLSLIDEHAVYWYTDGSFMGKEQIEEVFITTRNMIHDETYTITDIQWLGVAENTVSCMYTYRRTGVVDGEQTTGTGRGTNILLKKRGKRKIIHEHLSPRTI